MLVDAALDTTTKNRVATYEAGKEGVVGAFLREDEGFSLGVGRRGGEVAKEEEAGFVDYGEGGKITSVLACGF